MIMFINLDYYFRGANALVYKGPFGKYSSEPPKISRKVGAFDSSAFSFSAVITLCTFTINQVLFAGWKNNPH